MSNAKKPRVLYTWIDSSGDSRRIVLNGRRLYGEWRDTDQMGKVAWITVEGLLDSPEDVCCMSDAIIDSALANWGLDRSELEVFDAPEDES